MAYNYEAARAAGIPDKDIAEALARKHSYDLSGAMQSGLSLNQILPVLLNRENSTDRPETTTPQGETTILGQVGEAVKAVPRGFLNSFATSFEGLGQLADSATNFVGLDKLVDSGDDNEVVRLARAGQEKIDHAFGADPRYRDMWTTQFGEALGSLASFFVPGGAVKLLGWAGKGIKAERAWELAAGLPFAGSVGAGEASQRARAARAQGINVSQKQEDASVLMDSLIGLTDLLPAERIMKGMKPEDLFDATGKLLPLAKTWFPRLKSALSNGTFEAIQEVSSDFAKDVVEKKLYHPDLQLGQNAWDTITVAGASGFAADLVLNAMIGRRKRGMVAQDKAKEQQRRKEEAERMAALVRSPLPQQNTGAIAALTYQLPEPTEVRLRYNKDGQLQPEEVPVNPNRADYPVLAAKTLARRYEQNLGDQFPLNTAFSSADENSQPGRIVRDQDGNQYGPTFASPEQAAVFAGAMNEVMLNRSLEQQIALNIEQAALTPDQQYTAADKSALMLIGRKLLHPDYNTVTAQQLNYAAGTVVENGYAHEAMNYQQAKDAGFKLTDMTAAQRATHFRLQSGRPETQTYSIDEARQRLTPDQFKRLNDFRIAQIGEKETFRATRINGKPAVVSSLGETIYDRRRTLKELQSAPDKSERTPFRGTKDAANYAKYLNDKAKTGDILQSDLKAVDGVRIGDIRAMLKAKNITSRLRSEEMKRFAKLATGRTDISKMSGAELSLLYHKLRSLPSLESPVRIPVFGLKPYTSRHFQLARKAALEIGTNNEAVAKQQMPSRQDLIKAAGPITEHGYNALLRDVMTSRNLHEQIRDAQAATETANQRAAQANEQQRTERQRAEDVVRNAFKAYGLHRVGLTLTDYARHYRMDADGNVELGQRYISNPTEEADVEGAYSRGMNRVFLHMEALKQDEAYQRLVREGAEPEQLNNKLADLSLDAANHEVLHAMRQADLFTEKEWTMLEDLARTRKVPGSKLTYAQQAVESYGELQPVPQMEEAIAELVRDGLAGRISVGGPQKTLMKRIWHFLKGLAGIKSEGYETFNDLMSGIRTGKVAGRPEKIRTPRELERLSGAVPQRGITLAGLAAEPSGRATRPRVVNRKAEAAQRQPDWVETVPEAAQKRRPAILTSANPGNARGYGWGTGTPLAVMDDFTHKAVGVITDSDGQIPFIREMGIRHEVRVSYGTYEGLEPNIMVYLYDASPEQTRFIANVLGHGLLQDAALTVDPKEDRSGKFGGLVLTKTDGGVFSGPELQQIADAVNPERSPDGLNFTAIDPQSLVFIDSKQYMDDNYDIVKEFPAYEQGLLAKLPDGLAVKSQFFTQDGDYYSHENYGREIDSGWNGAFAGGSSNLQERLDDTLYKPFWQLYRQTTEQLGLKPNNEVRPQPGYSGENARSRRPAELGLRPGSRVQGRGEQEEGLILGEARQPGAKSYNAIHYGKEPVNQLLADKWGTGLRGLETVRLSTAEDPRLRRRVYFYIEEDLSRTDPYLRQAMAKAREGAPRRPEPGLGANVHYQRFGNILDPGTAEGRQLANNAAGPNEFESSVIDAGYDGYANPERGMMVVLNHDVPVNFLGDTVSLEAKGVPARTNVEETLSKVNGQPFDTVYSRRQGRAYYRPERVRRLIREYGYANGRVVAAVAEVNPKQFVEATVSTPEMVDIINSEAGPLDVVRLAQNDQTPFLHITKQADGNYEITGHEGRHRMIAMHKAGIETAPVVLIDRTNSGETLGLDPSGTLRGQTWARTEPNADLSYANPVDISYDNAGALQDAYGASGPGSMARQPSQEDIQRVVSQNEAENKATPLSEGHFSVNASPEAQYVARNPEAAMQTGGYDIAYARRTPTYSARGEAAINKAVQTPPRRGHPMDLYDPVNSYTPSKLKYALTKFKQEALNRYARLEQLNVTTELRDNLADSSSIAAALHADRAMGLAGAAIKYGVPVYHEGWAFVVNEKMANDLAKRGRRIDIPGLDLSKVKGLGAVNGQLFTQEHGDLTRMAQAYAVAQRGYRLNAEGLKNPLNDQEIADIENEALQFVDPATGENIIHRWWGDWQFYNEQVINFLQDTGILNDETADIWRQNADYFPFYRIAEGATGDQFHMGQPVFGGMTGAIHLKRLKGSEAPVNMDMLEAMPLNVTAAIQMGMKNVAQQRIVRDMIRLGLAEEIGVEDVAAPVVEFRVNGVKKRAAIYDPLIHESMQSLSGTDTVAMIRKTFGAPATLLREMVTREPGFMAVNLLRDSLASYTTSGARLKPIVSTMKGLFDGVETLEMLGAVGGYDYHNDPDDVVKFMKKAAEKAGFNPGGKTSALKLFVRLWDGLGHATTASDAATRNAVFDDVYRRTGNFGEATFQAMEVINFGRRGRHPAVRILTAVIPFLNARFQGVDVFYRAFTGQYTANKELNRRQVIMSALGRGSLLLGSTIAYYMMVGDDDQYKDAPDFMKDNNWIIPTSSGVPITLPIPFEVGLLFKVIPEMVMARAFSGKETGFMAGLLGQKGETYDVRTRPEAFQTLRRGFTSTMELSPFQIQFASPLMEAFTNYDYFTGRQIVPQYLMEQREPGLQSASYTNELAKLMGQWLNWSPMKIQHVVEGYGGTIGTYAFDLLDTVLKSETLRGDNKTIMPKRPWYDYPVIKRWVGQQNDRGFVQDAYDLSREVDKVYSTFQSLKDDGRMDEAIAYLRHREMILAMRGNVQSIKAQLTQFRQYKEMITRSNLPADVKRQQIDAIDEQVNYMLRPIMPVLDEMANLPYIQTVFHKSDTEQPGSHQGR